jgi:pilus assembly protein CpaF
MPNKLIVLAGPHEGVGKTTLGVNIAYRYSQASKRPVLLIDTDPLDRGEVAQITGTTATWSVPQILELLAARKTTLAMLRGRVPINRFGLGVLSLAPANKDTPPLTTEQWTFFFQKMIQIYDIFIDVDMISPHAPVLFDLADVIVWTLLPNALSIKATLQQLDRLQTLKISFHKFLFVLNQMGGPQALPEDAIGPFLDRYRKEIEAEIHFEPEIFKLLNQGKPTILEHNRTEFGKRLLTLMEAFRRFKSNPTLAPAALESESGVVAGPAELAGVLRDDQLRMWTERKQRIHKDLVEEINMRRIDLDTKGDLTRERQLRSNVESIVNTLIGKEKELALNREERERLVKELVDEALGLGPLEELLADPSVTEIMVNRFDQVFIERRGKIFLSDKRFVDNTHVIQVIRRIISPLGRRIDESVPMVDARLKDGSRVNAIIPPLAVSGPSLTIRRFPEKAFTPEDLLRMNAINQPMIDLLRTCVLLKKNMVISGGTGTGKTTILNMLSGFIPDDERIVTVEDTAELRMQQQHVVRLEARSANIEGSGSVTIRDLVKNCLRMRPDRIVVGECRGGEALDMLQAMNTGHDGSLTTVHANTPRDAFTRIETLCMMAGMDLPVWALREQIRAAVHILIQLTRLQDGSRRITCVTEVIGRTDETIETQDLFVFVQDGVDEKGRVLGHHEATGNVPKFFPELKSKGLALDIKFFQKKVA